MSVVNPSPLNGRLPPRAREDEAGPEPRLGRRRRGPGRPVRIEDLHLPTEVWPAQLRQAADRVGVAIDEGVFCISPRKGIFQTLPGRD
jgi:hypothetical protein